MLNIYNDVYIYIAVYIYNIHTMWSESSFGKKSTPKSFIDTSISARSMRRFKPLSIC